MPGTPAVMNPRQQGAKQRLGGEFRGQATRMSQGGAGLGATVGVSAPGRLSLQPKLAGLLPSSVV